MIYLSLNVKEATFLRGLIDIAIRSQGLQIARNAVILDDRIAAAMQEESRSNANVVTLNVPADGTAGSGGSSGG